jgi:uroporphyrin-III C-methyltransferase / precorrin-2 dehydrogenase / sirohydrochlorin ferrochelatase
MSFSMMIWSAMVFWPSAAALAVLLAQEGNRVVRLKGGDPLIFGRADEEITAANEAGVSFTIVNGISAAQGAAAALGASLTRRGVARRLQFVTAHAETGRLPESIDWGSVADPDVTTCIYMGRRNLGEFLAHAFAAGLDRRTPARFVINATLPDQHVIAGDAQGIGGMVAACERKGPGVLMLGHAFGDAPAAAIQALRLAAE